MLDLDFLFEDPHYTDGLYAIANLPIPKYSGRRHSTQERHVRAHDGTYVTKIKYSDDPNQLGYRTSVTFYWAFFPERVKVDTSGLTTSGW